MPDAEFRAIRGGRVRLRRFSEADLDAFVAYRADPETASLQSWAPSYDLADARGLLAEMDALDPDTPGEWFQFAMARRDDGLLIGDCAAYTDADDDRQAEIGFTLSPDHRGHGYATEGVRLLLDYLLRIRGKHRVVAYCDVRNARSAALLERVGMRREAHFIESTWVKGEWTSEYGYAVLGAEWVG